MIDRIRTLDAFGVPEDVTQADAEYVLIQLARCRVPEAAEKYREQLRIIETELAQKHRALVKQSNKRSK